MSRRGVPSLPVAYWKQWTASAISNLGDGINFVAMPLLALSLTDDERVLAFTTFTTFVPWLLLALPVGVVVDRLDRQFLLIVADLVRVALFAGVAVFAARDSLAIWMLFGLLLLIGACEVLFDSTAQAFIPMLVETHQLARANGLLFAAEVVAGSLAGLAIGAFLFAASVGLPFSVNALSFAVAAVLISTIRVRRVPGMADGEPPDRRLRAGLAWLRGHRFLSLLAAMFAVTNLGLMFGQGIFVKFAIDELGLSPVEYGLLLAITAMGAASGGLIGHRVIAAIGLRASVVAPYLVFGVAQIIIGLVPPVPVVAAAGFVMGAGITIWNVATVTVRQQLIPAELFGRVNSVYRWLGAAASAVGVAAGGFVAYALGLAAPFLVGGAVTLGAAALFGGPVLRGLAGGDGRDRDQPAPRTPAPPSIT